MKPYAFELIKHTLDAGKPLAAIALAYRIGRCKVLRPHRLVYGLPAAEIDRSSDLTVPGYHVECINSWNKLDPAIVKKFQDHPDLVYWDMKTFMDQGAKLWIGRLAGEVANLGGARTGDRMAAYFFPLLARKTAVFSHFATFPGFRGKKLFPVLLRHIMQTMAKEGVEQFYIDCNDWNIFSIRGIERAGFHLMGHGRTGRQGKLVWYQTAKPCDSGKN